MITYTKIHRRFLEIKIFSDKFYSNKILNIENIILYMKNNFKLIKIHVFLLNYQDVGTT
jgi:hypothetical protein